MREPQLTQVRIVFGRNNRDLPRPLPQQLSLLQQGAVELSSGESGVDVQLTLKYDGQEYVFMGRYEQQLGAPLLTSSWQYVRFGEEMRRQHVEAVRQVQVVRYAQIVPLRVFSGPDSSRVVKITFEGGHDLLSALQDVVRQLASV